MTIDTARCKTCNGNKTIEYCYDTLNGSFEDRPCPRCCTEPAPSAIETDKSVRLLRDEYREQSLIWNICTELLSARSRIAELSDQLQASQCAEQMTADLLRDAKARIAELEAYVRSVANNPDCAQASCGIGARALLPKESDAQGKRLPEREECEK